MASETTKSTCKFFIKRANRSANTRRKEEQKSDSDLSSSEDDTVVVNCERKRKRNLNIQSTHGFKRVNRNLRKNVRNASDDSDQSAEEAKESNSVNFKSEKKSDAECTSHVDVVGTLALYSEKEKDTVATFEKAREINQQLKNSDEDRIYKEINNPTENVKKTDAATGTTSNNVKQGPVRALHYIRPTVRWDYKPDLCKDYKETGFCGFGDSCIFLHDRTDYKSGWQIEMEVSKGVYGEEDNQDYEIKDEDEIPFKCLLCRESFKDPVVTKCKHYFCEKCALDHYKKSMRCSYCGAQTMGIFNPAREIIKRLNIKQKGKESSEEEDEEKERLEQENESDDDKCNEEKEVEAIEERTYV